MKWTTSLYKEKPLEFIYWVLMCHLSLEVCIHVSCNFNIGIVFVDSVHQSDCDGQHVSVITDQSGNNTATWHANGKFNEFKYWTLDSQPTPDDRMLKAIKWIKTSQHVRNHLSMFELDKQSYVI